MRILHFAKFFPPVVGGMEHFVADLTAAQVRAGHDVAALVHRATRGPRVDEVVGGIRVRRMRTVGQLLYTPVTPRVGGELDSLIAEFEPDLMHVHVPNVSPFRGLFSRRARRVPWVVHWHADVVASRVDRRLDLAYRFYRPFEQRLLRRADAIIATSPPYLASSEPLARWRDKCTIVPLGIDLARLPHVEPERLAAAGEAWPDDRLRVLAVGRMTYYKGYDVLLRALAEAGECALVLVGEGRLGERLRAQAEGLGVADRARFAGLVPDPELCALIAASDVVVMPSIERTEAFGLVLLEAMGYAKPTVATRLGGAGMGWIVEDEETGLLVEPGDPADLARALGRLAGDPALRARLGARGRERLESTFAIEAIERLVDEVYRTVR